MLREARLLHSRLILTLLLACMYALRLHSGTYCKETDTGGSNGAGMRYESEGGDPASE